MAPRRIGIVGYDGVMALDLTGPHEVFSAANELSGDGDAAYELFVLGLTRRPFTASSGLKFTPDLALADAPALDTIIVAGGAGSRVPRIAGPIADWLAARDRRVRRMASVCTGIYMLAATRLLDGRRATTHWRFAADVARRFPKIDVDPDAIFVRDGHYVTSAGVTAGIDLALALVEEDLGGRTALAVARELVVYLKRSGGQMQFSEPLAFQARATDRFADLAAWMVANLKRDLSVETLAAQAGFGARHFSRRFKDVFGATPADYVEALRLDEARKRLTLPRQTVDSVAASVGYANADTFRRAFERRFGVVPSGYKKQFAAAAE